MNDEQFQKMYAVELAKLAALQGIMSLVQAIAVKQGARAIGHNWNDVAAMLAHAEAVAAKQPSQ